MWIWSLLILSLSSGVSGNTYDEEFCSDRKACFRKALPGFPKSDTDLEKLCPLLLERLTCEREFIMKCYGVDADLHSRDVSKVLSYMKDVCKEGSKLRADIVKELPCVKELLDNRDPKCKGLATDAMNEFKKYKGSFHDDGNQNAGYLSSLVCLIFLERLECAQDFQNRCADEETDPYAENVAKALAYLNDLCQEGSQLRADVVKELPCIKQLIENRGPECNNLTRQAMTKYEEHKGDSAVNNEDPEYRKSSYCFFLVHTVACFAAEVERDCGAAAKDLVLDAHHRTGTLDAVCSTETSDDLLELVAVLEIEMEMQSRMRDIFLTIKNA